MVSETAPTANEVIVADRFAVDLMAPLPELDTAGGYAFAARDVVDPRQKVYGLIQRLDAPRRDMVVSRLKSRMVKGVLCPRGEGIVAASTGDGQGQRLCTIVEFPAGGRLIEGGQFPAFSERTLRQEIVPQLARTLSELHDLDITHRSLTLQDLYYRDRERSELAIGECFSVPPGFHLSSAQEPIERALALPSGRGVGDPACDMFALGTLIMSLYLGRDVTQNGGVGFLEQRIQMGSFVAFGGAHDGTGPINELLRGLLDDNAEKRWTADDVINWAEGLTVRKSTMSDLGWALNRPVSFQGRNFKDRRLLALAFANAPQEAIEFSQSERFRHWVNGGLAEGLSEEWLKRALDSRQFKAGHADDSGEEAMALARLMAVFFPEGPIVFGPLRFMPDGFVPLLTVAFADNDREAQSLVRDIISRGRLDTLLEILGGRSPSLRASATKFVGLSAMANNPVMGFGLERCLYELNKSLPCVSPKVETHYVDSLSKLAAALDGAAGRGEPAMTIIDAHVAAYLCRQSSSFETLLGRLAAATGQSEAYTIEMVRILGSLQERYYPHGLKNLAKGILPALKKLVEPLHSKTRRRQLTQLITRYIEEGNIFAIANTINFTAIKKHDERDFENVRRQIQLIDRERRRLEQPIGPDDARARLAGYRYAFYLACTVMGVFATSSLFQLLM